MQVIKKIFEYFSAEKYRDLDYGTIYYVAGEDPEINNYVLARIDQLSEKINQNERNWVTCKIVYLDVTNPFFNTRKKATLYSPMLPFEGSPAEANIFFAAYLDITIPEIVEEAISEYFSTLQQVFDEVLDTGKYDEQHLLPKILLQNDIETFPFPAEVDKKNAQDDGIRFSVTTRKIEEGTAHDKIKSLRRATEAPYSGTMSDEDLPKQLQEILSHAKGRTRKVSKYSKPSRLETLTSQIKKLLSDYKSKVKPGRLEITPETYEFRIPDYYVDIHFTPQVKALYILFLNHPEGIRIKEMEDYKAEYKEIFRQVTNRTDSDWIRKSVDKLFDACNPNAFSVKKSQCSEELRKTIPNPNLRRYYEIEVHRGLYHKINLDRSLVSMPDNLRVR